MFGGRKELIRTKDCLHHRLERRVRLKRTFDAKHVFVRSLIESEMLRVVMWLRDGKQFRT